DNLKRSEQALEKYEDELGMTEYYFAMQDKIEELADKVEQINAKLDTEETAELESVLADLKAHHEGELE
ncbi:MAG: YlxM family DNA-binding protein, partial [Bacillota bacterium]